MFPGLLRPNLSILTRPQRNSLYYTKALLHGLDLFGIKHAEYSMFYTWYIFDD